MPALSTQYLKVLDIDCHCEGATAIAKQSHASSGRLLRGILGGDLHNVGWCAPLAMTNKMLTDKYCLSTSQHGGPALPCGSLIIWCIIKVDRTSDARLSAMKTLIKWSVEDYHLMIEAGILRDRPVELLAGEIVESPPETPIHYNTARRDSKYLETLLEGVAEVRFKGPITLSDSEPEPDIAIVRLPASIYRDRHPQVDDIFWIIEVAKTSLKKDLELKSTIYARCLSGSAISAPKRHRQGGYSIILGFRFIGEADGRV